MTQVWRIQENSNRQKKDIIKDLDEISEALEESLRKQELAQEQE